MKAQSRRSVWSWAGSLIAAILIAIICRHFLFTPVMVEGKSMMPTFQDHNQVIVSKISKIERFDMIVFHSPISEDHYIKRVIGLPGDVISIKNDVLTINGKTYSEPYLKENKKGLIPRENLTENLHLTVPENSLYVMGDNRRDSMDSRLFGSISKDAVIGVAEFRFSPVGKMGLMK
ncbi:signal peptidase I [Bacillus mangrovi]|uniref:Signal peptidase I n=1 Tax=Metabacillus mangrovi TaxID=1491830 RepID=A0A7X2V743_9BACI|nr:signal peptidase I [Metabacillus mangrovi]MTH55696.1 signal peptidase I [Metabacillus mangrovi]